MIMIFITSFDWRCKMPKNFFLFPLVIFLLSIVYAFYASANDTNCGQIFKSTCQECHELDRGCERLGQSQEELKELFKFMAEMGADISDDEQKRLIGCLNTPDDSIKITCQK